MEVQQLTFQHLLNILNLVDDHFIAMTQMASDYPDEQPLDLSMKKDCCSDCEDEGAEDTADMHMAEDVLKYQQLQQVVHQTDRTAVSTVEYPLHSMASAKRSMVLWQFLLAYLSSSEHDASVIEWVSREKGVFRLNNVDQLAAVWSNYRERPPVCADHLKRSLRYYYAKNILRRIPDERDTYQFLI